MITVVFLAGIAIGAIGVLSLIVVARPVATLPPATARTIKRARRHARLRLAPPRWVAPARDDFEGRS